MYQQYEYVLGDTIEIECHWVGKTGRKGEQRGNRVAPTKEAVRRNNQKIKERYVRRLITLNFKESDLWCTLKYPAGTRKKVEDLKKDFKNFIKKLKYRFKKLNKELKYIYRMELSKTGGPHVHILINRIEDADIMIGECWKKTIGAGSGYADYRNLTEEGGYERLAAYIVKQPKPESEEYKQLSLFPEEERHEFLAYNSSRNLERPIAKIKTYTHWTMRKILEEGPKAHEGFYVVKESVQSGINAYTGWSFMFWTERRLKECSKIADSRKRKKAG